MYYYLFSIIIYYYLLPISNNIYMQIIKKPNYKQLQKYKTNQNSAKTVLACYTEHSKYSY